MVTESVNYLLTLYVQGAIFLLKGDKNRKNWSCCHFNIGKFKGKFHPRTGHEGPEVEKTSSSTLPSTSGLDGGGWSTPRHGRFTSGKDPVPIA